LLGFSFSASLICLLFLAIPLGLGAGSVDAALNNYAATHYKAHHMSWLHCFWGVGATLGPFIMSQFITGQNSWRNGYLTIAAIQFGLVALLFLTLPLWKRMEQKTNDTPNSQTSKGQTPLPRQTTEKVNIWRIKGVKLALVSFLFYCGVESTMGLWGSSFLVSVKERPMGLPVLRGNYRRQINYRIYYLKT
jgi:fucose permease